MVENENVVETPWQRFLQTCEDCTSCPLHKTRKNVVVWRGAVQAPFLIVGEGPGANEDSEGKPFVGKSGQLLDTLLQAFDIGPEYFHIANIVKCRPPENRDPSLEEAKSCRPLLNQQFQFVRPKVIMLLGSSAYRYFTGDLEGKITQVRGKWIQKGQYWIMPSFHPSFVLRDPKNKGAFWEDMAAVRKKLEELHCVREMEI